MPPESHGDKAPPFPASPWPGMLLALAVTLAAWGASLLPFPPFTIKGAPLEHPLGLATTAMLLGMTGGTFCRFPPGWAAGFRRTVATFIPVAIILLGAEIELGSLSSLGWRLAGWLPLMMLTGFGAAFLASRLSGQNSRLAGLLGIGTAVCGSSAVLALAPLLKAKQDEVALATSVVNLVGFLAMLACVALASVMPLDPGGFGFWTGASIHAVPQAAAAAETLGSESAALGTLVKLARVALLSPILVVTAMTLAKRNPDPNGKRLRWWKHVPWFIWGFAAMATVSSLGWLPAWETGKGDGAFLIDLKSLAPETAKWLLAIALAAIGLQVNIRALAKKGLGAIGAGLAGWIVLSAASYLVARFALS